MRCSLESKMADWLAMEMALARLSKRTATRRVAGQIASIREAEPRFPLASAFYNETA